MFALALEAGILEVFKHHGYSFDQEGRLQKEGAPIGLKIDWNDGQYFMAMEW